MWSNKGKSQGLLPGRETVGPLLLMAITPLAAILFVHANVDETMKGSLQALGAELLKDPLGLIKLAFKYPSTAAIQFLIGFSAFEILLQLYLPGKVFKGPITPAGHVPVYRANGFQAFIVTLVAFFAGSELGLNLYKLTIIWDLYAEIISTMCIFSFVFCAWLYIKGLYFPSGPDNGSSGNSVMDYYWGTELYPRIGSWDVKQFTNCRFGLMLWVLGPISFAAKQMELNDGHLSPAMAVNVALQLVYLAKFYWWETGYLASIDIMHDRAGYYICWGCLVWVPSVYISHSAYMVQNPSSWSTFEAALIFLAGYISIWINYDADRQRAMARSTDGNCIIWGKKAEVIRVKYITEGGAVKDSLLLASGWWSVSRHFHYLPELTASFFWALPAGFNAFMPYFYVTFLTFLLLDRGFRDDKRCRAKYNNRIGSYYDEYVKRVPYKFIPGLL